MTIAEMQAKHADIMSRAKAIKSGAEAMGRDMSDDEVAKVKALLDEADGVQAEIAKAKDKMALADRLKDVESAQPSKVEKAVTEAVRERVQDDPKRGFANIGDFASQVKAVHQSGMSEGLRILAAVGSPTQQQGVGADGGFLVPPAFSNSIYEGLTKEADSLTEMCDKYTIPYGVESMTFPADAETSRADGSRAGGIQGYWKSELSELTGSKVELREMTLHPQELYVFVFASDKLLRNSSVLAQYINKKATDEIKFKVNNAIISGTGVGQPKGILNAGCRVAVSKESGQAADTIVRQNIQKMWQRTLATSQKRGVWFYENSTFEQLSSISLSVGTGGVPAYMPPGGLSGAPYGTILGRPAMPLEYCPAVGDEGDLIFADMQAYALGMRGGVESAMSMHLKFDFAQTAFRFTFEIDGQPWLESAITPFTPSGTTSKTQTLSPFTTIADRA